MVDNHVLNTMLQTGILAISIPVVLVAAWKMRTRKSIVPVFAGVLIFLVFARGLEMIPHTVFLLTDNPVSRLLGKNAVLYALYGGLTAGLFEEWGRYAAFRFLIRKYPERETAVSYGMGHGGIECILILGVGYLQYYAYGQLLNNGTIGKLTDSVQGNSRMLDSMNQLVQVITGIRQSDCLIAGWERVSALMLQIALSILVYQAVREAGKRYMVWVAVFLHMMIDIPAALYQRGVLPLVPVECMVFVFAAAVLYYAVRVYRGMGSGAEDTDAAERHKLHQIANRRLKK